MGVEELVSEFSSGFECFPVEEIFDVDCRGKFMKQRCVGVEERFYFFNVCGGECFDVTQVKFQCSCCFHMLSKRRLVFWI